VSKEGSFKRNGLDVIKEDKDDDFCKYQEDFEIPEVVDIQPLKKNLELLLNPRSAEPHLHKSKALNLAPLSENILIELGSPKDLGALKARDINVPEQRRNNGKQLGKENPTQRVESSLVLPQIASNRSSLVRKVPSRAKSRHARINSENTEQPIPAPSSPQNLDNMSPNPIFMTKGSIVLQNQQYLLQRRVMQ